MSSSSSSYQQYGNPVLYTFVGFTLQPYWLIIAEMLFLQALQRINSLIGTAWPKRTGVAPLKYSVLDFFLSLVSVGHFVYSCYLQTKCSSASNANSWNCYNAFGYRLYNYVLPSVVSILVDSIVQLVNTYRAHQEDKKNVLLRVTLNISSGFCLVQQRYTYVNYIFMDTGCYLSWSHFAIRNRHHFCTHCVVGLQVFGCLVFSMAFNYSQYSFYGGDFNSVPWYEYQSRDTVTWFHSLSNSSELLTHNILAAF
ncbi:unnamed protein product [Adineta steineri]|uniref:Uncharacterized protein n=1 Tax=Adineta steineri TaxID=433720 RepID=A0A819SM42_9BILA|nr:unnamed protein product [Adineta steineri]